MKKITINIFSLLLFGTCVIPLIASAGTFEFIPCDGVDGVYLDNITAAKAEALRKAQEDVDKPSNAEQFRVTYKRTTESGTLLSLDSYTFGPDKMQLGSGVTYAAGGEILKTGGVTYTGPDIMGGGSASSIVVLKSGQFIDSTVQGNFVSHRKKKTVEELAAQYLHQAEVRPMGKTCDFPAFITLIKNVINSIIVLSIPIVTIALTWVGILLLTAQGNPGKITQAKQIAKSVIIGFVFILTAWLIVHTLVSVLLDDAFNLFLK